VASEDCARGTQRPREVQRVKGFACLGQSQQTQIALVQFILHGTDDGIGKLALEPCSPPVAEHLT